MFMVAMSMGLRIGRDPFIGDLGHIALEVAGVVVDVLDPAVGQVDGVGAAAHPQPVRRLLLAKLRPRVGVEDPVLEGVGERLVVAMVAVATMATMAAVAAVAVVAAMVAMAELGDRCNQC